MSATATWQQVQTAVAGAWFEMSPLLMQGIGRAADEQAATRVLRCAAEQDHPRACLNVAPLAATGRGGFDRDVATARKRYGRAAEAGNDTAFGRLAIMLLAGQGDAVDRVAARHWSDRARSLDVDALLDRHDLDRP